ncbi:hypothetical protein GALL_457210 [mine drainage metagenome]|uniref:Uncharacterized protein n=1 Tax=mine drainage metagenome TaxID=410659 RepID=A0A1J5Q9J8_9ZZZZ
MNGDDTRCQTVVSGPRCVRVDRGWDKNEKRENEGRGGTSHTMGECAHPHQDRDEKELPENGVALDRLSRIRIYRRKIQNLTKRNPNFVSGSDW